MKILNSAQIKELDNYTIEHEPVKSIDLMERASKALTRAISEEWDNQTPVVVFAGPGNNGGDALAVARMLADSGYKVSAYLFNIKNSLSEDCAINRDRLRETKKMVDLVEVTKEFDPPQLDEHTLVIDGLFGSGLNKPLSSGFASLVKYINASPAQVVSIDMPSGLMCEDNTYNIPANIIRANLTLTLQHKKLAFLFADTQQYIGRLRVLDIHLSKEYTEQVQTIYSMVEREDILPLLKSRDPFAHKGNMGHALIIAGSYGMAGAAVLTTKACLRSGAGKVTVHIPRKNYEIMQTAVPEAVTQLDSDDIFFSEAVEAEEYDALGVGPGLGTRENTGIALVAQLRRTQAPIVCDADALNILASHRAWMQQMPKDIILTPHPKEMERLSASRSNGDFELLSRARDLAMHLHVYIILKGHHSALCMPNGMVKFNTTGNAGMATAGCGDVLTGIITALLARGYNQEEACLLGMHLHGLAGDLAAQELGEESLMAGDIIRFLPQAFKALS